MSKGYEQRLTLLQLALGGVTGESADGCHTTFYDRRTGPYLGELVEGGYVLDKREPLRQRPSLALSSPMVDGRLTAGGVDRFDRDRARGSMVLAGIASDGDNPAAGLAVMMMDAPAAFGGFDFVAVDVFVSWWAERGAKVGRRVGDVIDWGGGEVTPIPPFDRRFTADTNAPAGD